uniref:VWFA domain-containing protein n=1 Tax=Erpetoichthys calabaricus TaxID=27687 RepID=A0A8C4TN35_ERPCA
GAWPYKEPPRDIMFLVDGSDDSRIGFPAMHQFMYNLVEDLSVEGAKDHIAVVQYSNEPEVDFYLNAHTAKDDVLRAIQGLRHKGGRPLNTGAALNFVKDTVFTSSAGSKHLHGAAQVLILLLAGRSADDASLPASSVKHRGVVPLAIGVKNAEIGELQAISFDPSYLPNIQQQLFSFVNRITRQRPPLLTTPVGKRMLHSPLVHLLSEFVKTVAEKFDVGTKKDRVAVVQFSDVAEPAFYLNTYLRKEDILKVVQGLRPKGGSPRNTGAALHFVKDNLFVPSAGSRLREAVPQILILLTSGRSEDDIRASADALKQLGVVSLTVGNSNADTLELQMVAFEPLHVFLLPDFDHLPRIHCRRSPMILALPCRCQALIDSILFSSSYCPD